MFNACQEHLDRYERAHPGISGNQLILYTRSLGQPLAAPGDVAIKVCHMLCAGLVAVHTGNPAVFDRRLRQQAEKFPRVFTPMLTNIDEISRHGLPSQVRFGAFLCSTALGVVGWFDFWKTPAELQGTLYAIPDVVTDGRLSQTTVPLLIGRRYVQEALDNAPKQPSLTSFPSEHRMYREQFTKEAMKEITTFYEFRRDDVVNMT